MNGKHRWMLATREMAGRLQGIRVLRSYLDGGSGEVTTRRVARNLRACRRGGLEAAVYREIKASLARHAPAADPGAADRPRTWGAALASGTTGGGSAISAGELR